MGFNFRALWIAGTLVLLSTLLLSSLLSMNASTEVTVLPVLQSGMGVKTTESDQKVLGAQLNKDKQDEPVLAEVVSCHVTGFVPEFDDAWCSAHYPAYVGQKITLANGDILIKDRRGKKLADYETLSLEMAPVSLVGEPMAKKQFEDAYIDVRGMGLMKIKSIQFNYSVPEGR